MARHRSLRRLAVAAVLLLGVPVVGVSSTVGSAAASAPGTVTNYTDPSIGNPYGIVAGPDGALWFTNQDANGVAHSISRITTTGTVTTYTDASIANPLKITVGPDGALWFTNSNASIGRITTTGSVTNYTDANIFPAYDIVTGPDGALWFTEGNSIGRITTTGTVTRFTDPSIDGAFGIAAGPDGALWFANGRNNSIARITTAGAVTNYTDASIKGPVGIAAGPDGALWFVNGAFHEGSIGRITTAGAISNYDDPSVESPVSIAVGPDGALWFPNSSVPSIGRITTTGSITHVTDPSLSFPEGIAAGPDGGMWFTNFSNHSIGRITPGEPEPRVLPGTGSVREGNAGSRSLRVPVSLSVASPLTVTVDWKTLFAPGAGGDQADPATDYTAASGTVTFLPGQTSKSVSVAVNGDVQIEPDEYVLVSFTNPTHARLGGFYGLGAGTIVNDDPKVVPGTTSVLEGDAGTTSLLVPVTLSTASTQTVTVDWTTLFASVGRSDQADPATDYTTANGTVTFTPGQTSQTVTIAVNGDTQVEPDEFVLVAFTNPTNAFIGGFYGLGVGTITNDD